MTARLTLQALLSTAFVVPAAVAQDYRIPDSVLARYGLPANPVEYARRVARDAAEQGPSLYFGPYRYAPEVGGCVSGGGWTTAAFQEMYRIAETDAAMRAQLAWGVMIGPAEDDFECSDDIPGFEAWVASALRLEHETGFTHASEVLFAKMTMNGPFSPEVHEAALAIALDPNVGDSFRDLAASALLNHIAWQIRSGRPETESEEVLLDASESILRQYGHGLSRRWAFRTASYLRANDRIVAPTEWGRPAIRRYRPRP